MVYDLPLVDVKVQPHHITTLHLVSALSFICTGAIIAAFNYTIPMWGGALLFGGLLLTAVTIVKNKWVTKNSVNRMLRIAELAVALAIAALSFAHQWKFPMGIFGVLSAVILFAIYWERAEGGKLVVHIDDTGISLPVISRRRFITWGEVEQVVYKFGTFTVNCTDNCLFQFNISGTSFDNEIFDAFCTAQIEKNVVAKKAVEEDW